MSQALKKFFFNNDLHQLGNDSDEDRAHHGVATANSDKGNVDGQVPSHDGISLAATHSTPSSLLSSVEKQVCCIHMFVIGTIPFPFIH